MQEEKRYCNKCGKMVRRETDKDLRNEYPFFCPSCDENMFKFETHTKEEKKQDRRKEL